MGKLLGMLPGGAKMLKQAGDKLDDGALDKIEAIIQSMTAQERKRPKIINGMRRKRIAEGSGRTVQEVNQLMKQWGEMNKMMGKFKAMTQGKKGRMPNPATMKQMMEEMGLK